MFKESSKEYYKPIDSDGIILKEKKICPFWHSSNKNKEDISYERYKLEATIYKGRYILSYKKWVEKIKINNKE